MDKPTYEELFTEFNVLAEALTAIIISAGGGIFVHKWALEKASERMETTAPFYVKEDAIEGLGVVYSVRSEKRPSS